MHICFSISTCFLFNLSPSFPIIFLAHLRTYTPTPSIDLLKKDFDTETLALKIKTNGPQGLVRSVFNLCLIQFALTYITPNYDFLSCYSPQTIDTKVDFFRADNLAATVSGKKKFPQFCVDKFEHKNNSMTLETSMDDLMPGLTLEFKYKQADKVSGSLSGTYKHPSATLTGDLDIVNYGLDASICSGADPVTMGGDISISNGALKNFSLGLGKLLRPHVPNYLPFKTERACIYSRTYTYISLHYIHIYMHKRTNCNSCNYKYRLSDPEASLPWRAGQ